MDLDRSIGELLYRYTANELNQQRKFGEHLVYRTVKELEAEGEANGLESEDLDVSVDSVTRRAEQIYRTDFNSIAKVLPIKGLNRVRKLVGLPLRPPQFMPGTIASTLTRMSIEPDSRRWLDVVPIAKRKSLNPVKEQFRLRHRPPEAD